MKGGINKIFRKVAATKGKSEFDKVYIYFKRLRDSLKELIT